jgi:hypothetical protein
MYICLDVLIKIVEQVSPNTRLALKLCCRDFALLPANAFSVVAAVNANEFHYISLFFMTGPWWNETNFKQCNLVNGIITVTHNKTANFSHDLFDGKNAKKKYILHFPALGMHLHEYVCSCVKCKFIRNHTKKYLINSFVEKYGYCED